MCVRHGRDLYVSKCLLDLNEKSYVEVALKYLRKKANNNTYSYAFRSVYVRLTIEFLPVGIVLSAGKAIHPFRDVPVYADLYNFEAGICYF